MQAQDEAINAAWSEVLNQYQRRADLVPNLVNVVKGYAAHEAWRADRCYQCPSQRWQCQSRCLAAE
jgi:hypothetical protein